MDEMEGHSVIRVSNEDSDAVSGASRDPNQSGNDVPASSSGVVDNVHPIHSNGDDQGMEAPVSVGNLNVAPQEVSVSPVFNFVEEGNGGARKLPDLLGEGSSVIRENLNEQLRKINALIANASEIQKRYHDEPSSQKSILEMLEKLLERREWLEEELHQLSRIEMRDHYSHGQPTEECLTSERTRLDAENISGPSQAMSSSSRPVKPSVKCQDDLDHSVGILRGNLREVLERKAELEAMVEVLRRKRASCETKDEQEHLSQLLTRHTGRICELNRTVQEAQKTLLAMESLNKQRSELKLAQTKGKFAYEEEDEDVDEQADEETMFRLRERLKKMRAQVEVIGDVQRSGASLNGPPVDGRLDGPVPRLIDTPLDPTRPMPVVNQSDIEVKSLRIAQPTLHLPGPPTRENDLALFSDQNSGSPIDNNPQHQNLNNAALSRERMLPWEVRDRAHSSRSDDNVLSSFFVRNDEGCRYEGHGGLEDEADEMGDDGQQFLQERNRRICGSNRPSSSAIFGKRNDLGLPQTPKKESNSRNWKNGAESGRGRLLSCSDLHAQETGERSRYEQEESARGPGGERSAQDVPMADMVRSLQLIMAEQQKILNTCAQYVSKSAAEGSVRGTSPDQSHGSNRGGISIINNSLRHGDSCSTRNNARPLNSDNHCLLNNQRNDARSFSMSPNILDGVSMDGRRNVAPTYSFGFAGDGYQDARTVWCSPRFDAPAQREDKPHEPRNRGQDSVAELSGLMKRILVDYKDDLPSLHYMLDCISSLTTSSVRARVAGQLGFIVAAERGIDSSCGHVRPRMASLVTNPSDGTIMNQNLSQAYFQSMQRPTSNPPDATPDLVCGGDPRPSTSGPTMFSRGSSSRPMQVPTRNPVCVDHVRMAGNRRRQINTGLWGTQRTPLLNSDPPGFAEILRNPQYRSTAGPLNSSFFTSQGNPSSIDSYGPVGSIGGRGSTHRTLSLGPNDWTAYAPVQQWLASRSANQGNLPDGSSLNYFAGSRSMPPNNHMSRPVDSYEPNERNSGSNGSTADYDMANDYSRGSTDRLNNDGDSA